MLWLAALLVAGATCAFPTDKSDEVIVLVQSSSGVVIRGKEASLFARAFRVVGTDTVDVRNVSFLWSSGNPTLATVQDAGGGYAHVTGVNSGVVAITARAVAFEQAETGSLQVRVSNPLEVDSVRPSLVRFGDTITVYGVGVDSIVIAFLLNTTLFDYPIPGAIATRTRDSLGFGKAVFWVTPPARTSLLTFIGPGVFGSAPDTTRVQPFDLFEPNETVPSPINLDAPPRFPTLPFFKFLNPALAFEIPKRDQVGVEWYRFSQTTARDLTLILSGPEVRGTFSTFLTDSLSFAGADSSNPTVFDYSIGPASWTMGPGSHFCGGFPFEPPELQPESTVVALRGMPAGALHTLALYAVPGRYGLGVIEGYVTTDPTIPRDDHEEDDFCSAPRALAVVTNVPTALRDTLTIDNPHDVDWIRFHVTAGLLGAPRRVTLKMAAITGANDSSDVDLYLLNVPGGGTPLERARSVGSGSNELITQSLAQGDYYAVVVDYIGRPVRYGICIEEAPLAGPGCTTFPAAPPVAGGSASKMPRPAASGIRLRPAVRP